MDIQRLKEGYADGFVPGDLIVIQEKFDGSNAAASSFFQKTYVGSEQYIKWFL